MGLAGADGEEEVTVFAEVLACGGGGALVVSVRRRTSTSSWKGSGELILASRCYGPDFCYNTEGTETDLNS